MGKRRRPAAEQPLVVWLLGFHLVRLAVALIGWILTLGLGTVVLVQVGRNTDLILVLVGGYVAGSLLSVMLWLWYRGWWHLGDQTLLRLTPRQFEEAIATLLTAQGYHDVKVTGGPGDLGADVVCRDDEGQLVAV